MFQQLSNTSAMGATAVKQLFAFPYPPFVAKLLEWGSLVLSLKTELLNCVFLCSPEYFTVFVVSVGFFKVKMVILIQTLNVGPKVILEHQSIEQINYLGIY